MPAKTFRVVSSAVLAVLMVALLAFWMDLPKLLRSLKEVSLAPVVVACLLNVGVLVSKGLRWWVLGAASSSLSALQSVRLTILSFVLNSFIPARGGDVARALVAARENSTSKAASLASVGLDKLMDMIAALGLAVAFPFLPGLPEWIKKGAMATTALVLLLCAAVLYIVVKGRIPEGIENCSRVRGIIDRIAVGFGSATKPRVVALALALSCSSYGLQMAMLHLCALSAGLHMTLPEVACALLVLNIAVSVPLTPLNVGTLHAAMVAALLFFGYQKEPAMISAITLHIAYMLPLFVLAPMLGFKTILRQYR